MPASPDTVSMAMFCDFENVALGVRDAKYDKFDIKPVLERLLLKGSIVVKKAYCDWERYKGFKATMHEANFELIEIPHVRQSGKNSADIRMVVDALDLCYTKAHVNTFVIVSGDSDFSPLVSKLRENAKYVIGVGIKQSTSDLLIANCDEFIFYDDLVRESQRSAARRDPKAVPQIAKRSPEELEARRSEAVELAVSTFDALVVERGDSSKIWASMLKEAVKRRRPDFNESHFGFRAFGNLLDEAQARGLFEVGRDEKSGAYVFRASAPHAPHAPLRSSNASSSQSSRSALPVADSVANGEERSASAVNGGEEAHAAGGRRRGRGGRGKVRAAVVEVTTDAVSASASAREYPVPAPDVVRSAREDSTSRQAAHEASVPEASAAVGAPVDSAPASPSAARKPSRGRSRNKVKSEGAESEASVVVPSVELGVSVAPANDGEAVGSGKKPAARRPRTRKTAPPEA